MGKIIAMSPEVDASHKQTDETLLFGCRQRRQTALVAFYERHAELVWRFFARSTGARPRLALLEQTFVALWTRADEYDARASPRSWLLNLADQRLRDAPRAPSQAEHPAELSDALAGLEPALRSAFVVCDVEEISGAEAGAGFGASTEVMWERLMRARKRLQTTLGHDATAPSCDAPPEQLHGHLADPSLKTAHHVARCDACAAIERELSHLRALAQRLPIPALTLEERVRARDHVLESILTPPPKTPATPTSSAWLPSQRVGLVLLFIVSCLTALIGASLLDDDASPEPPSAAAVVTPSIRLTPSDDASFLRRQDTVSPIERIRLRQGDLTIDAHHQEVVLTAPDAEIKTSDAHFEASVRGKKLTTVTVIRGHLSIYQPERPPIDLPAGGVWRSETLDPARPLAF